MLTQIQESPFIASGVKRFAIKKEIPDLKSYRKFYNQYVKHSYQSFQTQSKKVSPIHIRSNIKRLQHNLKLKLEQNNKDKPILTLDFEESSLKKLNQIDHLLTHSSDTVRTESNEQKEIKRVGLKEDTAYRDYLNSQFTKEKQQQCYDWLMQNNGNNCVQQSAYHKLFINNEQQQ